MSFAFRTGFTAFVLFFSVALHAQEICTNNIDDDGDGLVDCNDPDCQGPLPAASIFNTASNGSGGTLPVGSNDQNWTVSVTGLGGPYAPTFVLGPPTTNPYVVSPWPDAQWISADAQAMEVAAALDPTDPNGSYVYHYRLTFQLPCVNGCGGDISDNFCVKMDFFADNAIMAVFVNDIEQPATANMNPQPFPGGYYGFHAENAATITLCDDWQPGLNTITVRTLSGGGLQAFLAQLNPDFEPVENTHPPTAQIDSVFYICGVQPVKLFATGYDSTDILHWNTGSTQDTLTVTATGTYTLIVTNDCGSDTVSTKVKSLQPAVQMADTAYICGTQNLPLYATGYDSSATLLWNTGSANDTLIVNTPGTYTLTVTTACGSTSVSTHVLPTVPSAHLDSLFYVCGPQNVPLYATDYGPGVTFLWSDSSTGDTLWVHSTGTYTLIVANACGSDTLSTEVTLTPPVAMDNIPNIFTPNGDGVNDIYVVENLFTYATHFNTKIYNRWGNKMYDTNDPQINWSPKNISDGVYFLAIFYTGCDDKEEQKLALAITVISHP